MGEPGYPVSGGCCTVHSSRWALLPVRISLGRSPDRHEAAANILRRLRAEQLSCQRIYPPQPSREQDAQVGQDQPRIAEVAVRPCQAPPSRFPVACESDCSEHGQCHRTGCPAEQGNGREDAEPQRVQGRADCGSVSGSGACPCRPACLERTSCDGNGPFAIRRASEAELIISPYR